jgi:hypothetical protein
MLVPSELPFQSTRGDGAYRRDHGERRLRKQRGGFDSSGRSELTVIGWSYDVPGARDVEASTVGERSATTRWCPLSHRRGRRSGGPDTPAQPMLGRR